MQFEVCRCHFLFHLQFDLFCLGCDDEVSHILRQLSPGIILHSAEIHRSVLTHSVVGLPHCSVSIVSFILQSHFPQHFADLVKGVLFTHGLKPTQIEAFQVLNQFSLLGCLVSPCLDFQNHSQLSECTLELVETSEEVLVGVSVAGNGNFSFQRFDSEVLVASLVTILEHSNQHHNAILLCLMFHEALLTCGPS